MLLKMKFHASASRTRILLVYVVTPALICLGLIRMFGLVLETPVHAYANQYDMLKLQACYGLWQRGHSVDDYQPTPAYPISTYEFGKRFMPACLPQTGWATLLPAVAYAKLTQPLQSDGKQEFPVRFAGIATILWFFAVCVALTWIMRSQPKMVVFNAIVFSLVLADPMNTLWFNGFYSEAHAVLFAYFSTALLIWILHQQATGKRLKILFMVSLFLFGFSKIQHMLFPALFALILLTDGLLRKNRSMVVLASQAGLVAVLVLAAQAGAMSRNPDFRSSTTSDMLLGAVLPASPDPASALKLIDLPPRCANAIGLTWFENKAAEIRALCPEAFTFSRAKLVPLLLEQPVIFSSVMAKALPQAKPWILDNYLGVVEGKAWGTLETDRPQTFSVAASTKSLPTKAWFLVYAMEALIMVVAIALYLRSFFRQPDKSETSTFVFWIPLVSSGLAIAISLIAVFGNGYSEVARHSHLSYFYTSVLLLWIAGYALLLAYRSFTRGNASTNQAPTANGKRRPT